MSNNWLTWNNPVSIWWFTLTIISVFNIVAWMWTYVYYHSSAPKNFLKQSREKHLLLLLSSLYVFGCGFRSFLPRADVQRICLWDTWFSNVFIGRSVATIAELAFVAQWALIIHNYSNFYQLNKTKRLATILVPLIFLAEIFSWYAVITTNYLGNTLEESIWTITYMLIALALYQISRKLNYPLKFAGRLSVLGCLIYVSFMISVDVPMYYFRWLADTQNQKPYLDFWAGIQNLLTVWHVNHNITDWKTEIPWMTAYFSAAVWTSILLCYVPLFPRKK
jgi:hypothetical protein